MNLKTYQEICIEQQAELDAMTFEDHAVIDNDDDGDDDDGAKNGIQGEQMFKLGFIQPPIIGMPRIVHINPSF